MKDEVRSNWPVRDHVESLVCFLIVLPPSSLTLALHPCSPRLTPAHQPANVVVAPIRYSACGRLTNTAKAWNENPSHSSGRVFCFRNRNVKPAHTSAAQPAQGTHPGPGRRNGHHDPGP